ncbi:MAG: phosphatidate cytidylyltransferase [Vicinamibacterales bacterium]
MTRLLSGVVLIAAMLAAVWYAPPAVFLFVLGIILVAACIELVDLMLLAGVGMSRTAAIAGALAACAAVASPGAQTGFLLVGTLLALLVVVLATRAPAPDVPAAAAAAVFPVIYLAVPLALAAVVRDRWGREALLLGLLVVWISDTAQFYVGSRFGRRRLAPAISPKKSVEGAIGGFIAGTAAMTLIGHYWLPLVSVPVLAAAGAVLVALGIAGDLFESLLKRSAKVKDSSALIPGHGGVLDRIDALLFAIPGYYLILALLT